MNKNTIARYIALPIVSAGIFGGAALGLAGMASAATNAPTGPGYSYAPGVKAHPAPAAKPGFHNHKGIAHVNALTGH
ncbi:MAG TPA: hypothetical protein VJR50_02670 [Mycobacterium sp.]|jgi:hypothetical protein|nr:hypothetical protein [Mycobacterium sp.]